MPTWLYNWIEHTIIDDSKFTLMKTSSLLDFTKMRVRFGLWD